MKHLYYVSVDHKDTHYFRVNEATGEYQRVTIHRYLFKTRYTLTSGDAFLMPNGGISRIEADRYKAVFKSAILFHNEL